jgi:hypothetical protein
LKELHDNKNLIFNAKNIQSDFERRISAFSTKYEAAQSESIVVQDIQLPFYESLVEQKVICYKLLVQKQEILDILRVIQPVAIIFIGYTINYCHSLY